MLGWVLRLALMSHPRMEPVSLRTKLRRSVHRLLIGSLGAGDVRATRFDLDLPRTTILSTATVGWPFVARLTIRRVWRP